MSRMSLLGLWILCFFYFYISWMLLTGGSVFLPWGLRAGRCCCALICIFIGPYGFLSSAFFFGFVFLSLLPPFPHFILPGFWQFAFTIVEVWPHFLVNAFEKKFFLIWSCSDFYSVRKSLLVVSLAWFLSSGVGSGQRFCARFSHVPCFGFECWLCVVDLAWCWPAPWQYFLLDQDSLFPCVFFCTVMC